MNEVFDTTKIFTIKDQTTLMLDPNSIPTIVNINSSLIANSPAPIQPLNYGNDIMITLANGCKVSRQQVNQMFEEAASNNALADMIYQALMLSTLTR